jgi:hypothetical protein
VNLLWCVQSNELASNGGPIEAIKPLWMKNIGTMDKVQKVDRSNTAPSSETFRDELTNNL